MINNNKQRIYFWTKVLEDLAFKRYTTCMHQNLPADSNTNTVVIVITMSDCLKSDSVCVYVTCQCVLCVCLHCV